MAYLSKVSLRRDDGSTGTLIDILRRDKGLGGEHKLVWTLFSEAEGAKRDFLFRRGERDGWLVLSQRMPVDRHHIWDIETKHFNPTIHPGQELAFRLRANPRISVRTNDGRRVKHDFIQNRRMELRKEDGSLPPLADVLPSASHEWLARQGKRAGFGVEPDLCVADCYVQHSFPRDGGGQASFRSIDYRGILTVTDPGKFLAGVYSGFGGGRAYGFGTMLLSTV
jgi:CRISPR system Cascade subunit CasE